MKDFKEVLGQKTIEDAAELDILDVNGDKNKFGTLFKEQKTIVVFISEQMSKEGRENMHGFSNASEQDTFFAGYYQLYVESLAAVPSEALAQAGTRIVVIGCGEYNPIKSYKESTGFSGPIYADPTRKLYHTLGMDIESFDKTPPGEQRRSYLTLSAFSNIMISLWRGLRSPSLVGKQGNLAQLGGDFIFGPGNLCSFASRMKHTEDHVEVADLMREAGVLYSQL